MGCGATVARSAELGRDTAARCRTRSRLGHADCSRGTARTAGTGARCTGGACDARVAQWLRHDGRDGQVGRHDGRDGQVGRHVHQPSNQVRLGRKTGP